MFGLEYAYVFGPGRDPAVVTRAPSLLTDNPSVESIDAPWTLPKGPRAVRLQARFFQSSVMEADHAASVESLPSLFRNVQSPAEKTGGLSVDDLAQRLLDEDVMEPLVQVL